MADDFSERYGDLLTGSYDCVDRIVLNAYFSMGHNPGRFRSWWCRLHGGSDGQLDNCFTGIADPQRLAQVADTLLQDAAIGRLGQVWICDRTRSRLDLPTLRTVFGLKNRPHHNRASGPPAQDIVIEKPQYGLSWFRIRFGLLQLKAYTKGEHVLRIEATVHNTKELHCRRGLDNFPQIITRLAGMASRFATTLDCADISFLPDGTLDEPPLPARLGATRTGGIDLSRPRMRAALAAALALAAAPHGFAVADLTAKVQQMTRQPSCYTIRQAAYDLRKLRGKNLVIKPGRTRRYHVPPGVRSPSGGHPPQPR